MGMNGLVVGKVEGVDLWKLIPFRNTGCYNLGLNLGKFGIISDIQFVYQDCGVWITIRSQWVHTVCHVTPAFFAGSP